MSNFVRIPHRLAVEPLEVLYDHRSGRIVETPQDLRSWEDKERSPRPITLWGTWYPTDADGTEPFDLRYGNIVEVDIADPLNAYILMLAATRKGYQDLAAALAADNKDLAEDILDSLIEKENA